MTEPPLPPATSPSAQAPEAAPPTSRVLPPLSSLATRLVWPLALLVGLGMTFAFLRERSRASEAVVTVQGSNTLVTSLRDLARLETTSLHVEKVIDVRDAQKALYGLIETEDALLFVASGEVLLGVDLGHLREGDVAFDEATRTARITLPDPEVLATRFDELHSYVHSRTTGTLAKRNEQLEAIARRQATEAFAAVGRDPKNVARAREQAERQLRALATAWGARDVVVSWRALAPTENAPAR